MLLKKYNRQNINLCWDLQNIGNLLACSKVIAMLLLLHNIIAVEKNKIVTLWQLACNV